MTKEDLGYGPFFEAYERELPPDGRSVARVVSEHKEAYRVKDMDGEYPAKITGRQMFEASSRKDYPAVGDWVTIAKVGGGRAVIHDTLPRRTVIERKHGDGVQIIAANIDVAFVVESVGRDYNLNRFERYFSIAREGGVTPAIILNKVDLLSEQELDERASLIKNRFRGVDTIFTSTVGGEGLKTLEQYIEKGKTYCFLGSSGVGKSTLINRLLGKDSIETDDISAYSHRGKHVTTGRQMYFLESGGIVIDNPGMREVGMADAGEGIDAVFSEIAALARKCKYADCTHTREPGCAVIQAVGSKRLDEKKYSNYVALKKETEFYEMDDVGKREKDRRFGKFLKKAKEELKKFGSKDLT